MKKTTFPTSATSPFEDKFDLPAAIALVGDLYQEENPDESDPRYELLLQIWDHEEMLKAARVENNLPTAGAGGVVDLAALNRPGQLRKTTSITLHTVVAQQAFTGRRRQGDKMGIPSLLTLGAACFRAELLTSNDNPYADWLLIHVQDSLQALSTMFQASINKYTASLKQREAMGIKHSIAESNRPLVIEHISFGSAYGYRTVDTLAQFDYAVRVTTTVADVGLIKTDEGRAIRLSMLRHLRRFVYQTVRTVDILSTEKLRQLSRADFAENASDEGKLRVALAAELIPKAMQQKDGLPADIFSGKRRPDHYRAVRSPTVAP